MKINRRSFIQKSSILAGSSLAIDGFGKTLFNFNPNEDWSQLRKAFPLHDKRTYFNNGTFGPSPFAVVNDLKNQFNEINTTGNYGSTAQSIEVMGQFINADKSEVALTHNTSEGINIMAWGLKLEEGDEVIMTDHEHVGNAVPWLNRAKIDGIKLKVFSPAHTAEGNIAQIKKLVSSRTKVIAIPHITCTTGLVFPIEEIASFAREKGIITAIDGAHGLGTFDLDIKKLGVDMYASCGHKWLLGPGGTGMVYINKDILDDIIPVHVGAYSVEKFDLNTDNQALYSYTNTAHKFFYGTQSAAQFSGMAAAANFHSDIGKNIIEDRIRDLNEHLFSGLTELGSSIEILTAKEKASRINMVTFKHKHKDYKEIGKILREEKFRVRLIHESHLDAVRISTHIYNSKDEIDRLLATIEKKII